MKKCIVMTHQYRNDIQDNDLETDENGNKLTISYHDQWSFEKAVMTLAYFNGTEYKRERKEFVDYTGKVSTG